MKTIFTKEEMMKRKGCYSEQQVVDLFFTDNTEVTIETILNSEIPIKDKGWFVYNSCDLTIEERRKLTPLLDWVVLPLFEDKYFEDRRVRACLEGIEKFLNGEIDRKELSTLRSAAFTDSDAAFAAAEYAAAKT